MPPANRFYETDLVNQKDIADVESLIRFSQYLGQEMETVKGIRKNQDTDLSLDLARGCLKKIGDRNKVKGDRFFLGSVDFMIDLDGSFRIIEANGGSSRGISSIPSVFWSCCYEAILEMLEGCTDNVLIGHPNNDVLMYEKILLLELIVDFLDEEFYHPKDFKEDSGIIFGSYKDIISNIDVRENTPYFNDEKIGGIIGDGVARRIPALVDLGKKGKISSSLANHVFPITDDKSLTYRTVDIASNELKEYGVDPIEYSRVETKDQLIKKIREYLGTGGTVIKPHGGSGGRGIQIIENEEEIESKVEDSLLSFIESSDTGDDGFPYTVSEKIDSRPVKWMGEERNFDLRLYVALNNGRLIPCGGLARSALAPKGESSRESVVVNLSGHGSLQIERGIPINQENLNRMGLDREDLVNLMCASIVLFRSMVENLDELLKEV